MREEEARVQEGVLLANFPCVCGGSVVCAGGVLSESVCFWVSGFSPICFDCSTPPPPMFALPLFLCMFHLFWVGWF